MQSLEEQAKGFPEEPGVYFFYNAKKQIVYIGKAKNLRKRISQYMNRSDSRPMIHNLLAESVSLSFSVTQHEKQALILEAAQIKEHKPKYNIRLLDGGRFCHYLIDYGSEFPLISLVYYPKKRQNHQYLGPFVDTRSARDTFDFINKQFRLRTCSDRELQQATRKKRPCLEFHMHRCLAPCIQHCSVDEYTEEMGKVLSFLQGNQTPLLDVMTQRMMFLAKEERFEDAIELRNQKERIEKLLKEKETPKTHTIDQDYWGFVQVGNSGVYAVLSFRRGEMRPVITSGFSDILEETPEEMLSSLLNSWYTLEVPHEILLPWMPESAEVLEEVLSERAGRKVKISVPQRGEKIERLQLATTNAEAKYKQMQNEVQRRKELLIGLQKVAKLSQIPFRIECFDNSHLGGSNPVSAMVVFEHGKPNKHAYRKFTIKEAEGNDDYGMMKEVLRRRFKRALRDDITGWELPQLLIVDGGKGQLQMALEVFDELDIGGVDVIGFVKPRVERKQGHVDAVDKIVSLEFKDPIELPKDDKILLFLQQIRDETHNTVVSYQRERRDAFFTRSHLDAIEGVGPKMKSKLLEHFGSVGAISVATESQLQQVSGVGKQLAEKIVLHFQQVHQVPTKIDSTVDSTVASTIDSPVDFPHTFAEENPEEDGNIVSDMSDIDSDGEG